MLRRTGFALLVVPAVAFATLAVAARGGPLPGDATLAPVFASWRNGLLDLVSVVASLAVWPAVLVALAAALWRDAGPRAALALCTAVVTAELASYLVKALVDRPRPVVAAIQVLGDTASFPSNSVVRVTVTLGVLLLLLAWQPGWRALPVMGTLLTVTLVGVARIASGEHWPSDVLGAYVLGGLWVAGLGGTWRNMAGAGR
jgi:undecaprenyl-diphosphatase